MERFVKKAARFDPFEVRRYEPLLRFLRENRRPVEPRKLGLKLIMIADTHGSLVFGDLRLKDFLDAVGEYDLCLLLGDIRGVEMLQILEHVPREKILAVKGNHDTLSFCEEFGVRDLSGDVFTYKGVRFAGLDGSFRYKPEKFPSHTQYQSLALARAMPPADVLITHDVPLSDVERSPVHAGLIGISYYVYANRVPWHIHGHIHKSYQAQYDNGTNEKSVYLCECIEI